jgi:hypothetical protein
MSVLSFLTRTASAAVLSVDEQRSIATSRRALEERLGHYFPANTIKRKLQFGSSTRGTILPRLIDEQSDVDFMIVFSDATFTTATYLSRLRSFVEKHYSASNIYQSHPTIVLELNHIKFDLVPATEIFLYGLQIPGKDGNWIGTNPNDFNEKLEQKNVKHNHQIKPAIRLLKIWNARHGFPFDSYRLEQQICGMYFSSSANLKDIFFAIFENLSTGLFAPKWIKDHVTQARLRATKIQDLEARQLTGLAEIETRRLLCIR